MEDCEHEVYGGEIPDVTDMEGDMDRLGYDADNSQEPLKLDELNDMKRRLKDMEDEAAALRQLQARVKKEMADTHASIPRDMKKEMTTQAVKNDTDARSVYVGNVDYSCTPEEVQQHFQSCGTVNRVTILTDKFSQPKGFAYVEFLEIEAVRQAVLLNGSLLHARMLKVSPKRTNLPGMKNFRPRRPYVPHYSPYGKFHRFRRQNRYIPYGHGYGGHYY